MQAAVADDVLNRMCIAMAGVQAGSVRAIDACHGAASAGSGACPGPWASQSWVVQPGMTAVPFL